MWISSVVEKRATTKLGNPDQWLHDVLGAGPNSTGEPVTEKTALGLPIVYTCIRILADAIATLPIQVYKRLDGENREKDRKHPLWRLLNLRPNADMTAVDYKAVTMMHLAGWGNHYSVILRNEAGRPLELLPLSPNATRPRRIEGEIFYETVVDGHQYTIPNDDVLHIRGLGFDGLIGWSPIRVHAEQIGVMLAQQKQSGRFYGNGATLMGVLHTEGTVKDPDRLRSQWERLHRGADRAFKTAILENGLKYERIGIPPAEAQFVEDKRFNALQAAMIYGIPPHRINLLERVTFNNIEQLGIDFVTYTLGPWFVRYEQEITLKLLTVRDQVSRVVKFNADALLRGDFKTRAEGDATLKNAGIITANEARRHYELNDHPDGDGLLAANAPAESEPDEPEPDEMDETETENDEREREIIGQVVAREVRRLRKELKKVDNGAPADLLYGQTDHLIEVFHAEPAKVTAFLRDLGTKTVLLSESTLSEAMGL